MDNDIKRGFIASTNQVAREVAEVFGVSAQANDRCIAYAFDRAEIDVTARKDGRWTSVIVTLPEWFFAEVARDEYNTAVIARFSTSVPLHGDDIVGIKLSELSN